MKFQYWHEGIFFILGNLVVIGFPCIATTILGIKLIDQLGQWPSRSSRIQMSVLIPFIAVQVISFVLLAVWYKIVFVSGAE